MKKKVLMFCDPGIDDSLAIMYALSDPFIELIGLVVSYGNVSKKQAVTNAAYVLHLAGRTDIPLISGASMPIVEENLAYYPDIHGEGGMGPFQLPAHDEIPVRPFAIIPEIIARFQGEVIIVDTGRMTALAAAFVGFEKEMKDVHSFYIMGGAFFIPGNATPLAEANVHGDPHAAQLVISRATSLTLAPLNVTNQAVLPAIVVEKWAEQAENPFSHVIRAICAYYMEAHQQMMPGILGAPIHDLVPLMLIRTPQMAGYIERPIEIVTYGKEQGLTYIDFRPGIRNEGPRIAVTLDYPLFLRAFKEGVGLPL
jgi:purine nucleosidase